MSPLASGGTCPYTQFYEPGRFIYGLAKNGNGCAGQHYRHELELFITLCFYGCFKRTLPEKLTPVNSPAKMLLAGLRSILVFLEYYGGVVASESGKVLDITALISTLQALLKVKFIR